jgi:hypothetical protein
MAPGHLATIFLFDLICTSHAISRPDLDLSFAHFFPTPSHALTPKSCSPHFWFFTIFPHYVFAVHYLVAGSEERRKEFTAIF